MSGKIEYINKDNYNEKISTGLVAVDFYSDECPPCDALAPKFEGLAELYEDIKFYKIFRQENRDIAESIGINGSPTVIFYKNGKRIGDFLTGGIKRSDLIENLDKMLDDQKKTDRIKSSIKKQETDCDVLIIGGGPGGLAAAIYASQAKLKTILVDIALPGGQVSTTHQVSNYPGFIEPQPGFMLSHYMSEQAKAAGTEYRVAVDITKINPDEKYVVVDDFETIRAKKMIIASGASPRPLRIPGEKEYKGQGISYCATCDAKYYEGKEVVVIGGGNSAIEEALYITKFASKVTIVHQFAELQANKEAQQKAFDNTKINFILEHEPREFKKTDKGMDIIIEDLKSEKNKIISTDGIFVFVGMKPNLDGLQNKFDLDDYGYIQTNELQQTNIKDVFAVGDVASKPFRQITIAVAEGSVAAIQTSKELFK